LKNKVVKSLALGGQHSAVITDEGELLVSGSARMGI